MALPTVVGVGSAAADVGAITPTLPSGVQANDILLLFVETANEDITVSGWEHAPNSPASNATTGTRLSIFWKRAGDSETDPTTSDSGDHQIGQIMAVRGCYTGGNPFTLCRGGTTASGSSKSSANINTYSNDVLVIGAFSSGQDGFTTAKYSGWTASTLTNIVERMDYFSDVGNGGGFGVATGERASASYGTVINWTVTDSSSTNAGAVWNGGLLPADVAKPFIRSVGNYASGVGAVTPAFAQNYAVVDDLIMVFCETNNQAITISGYSEAPDSPASNAGTAPTRLTVFYKRAGVGEANPTTSDSGDHQVAQTITLGGVSLDANPFDVTAVSAGGTGTSVSAPTVTTTVANTMVVAAVATTRDLLATTTFSGWTNADLTDLNELLDQTVADGTGGGFGVAVGRKAASGSVAATTATQATAVEWAAWTAAIKPLDYSIAADTSGLSTTGQDAFIYVDKYFFGDASAAALAGEAATLTKKYPVSVTAGALQLFGGEADVLGASPETFSISFIVDLLPPDAGGTYQRYTERLTVDGTELKVRSWTYEESASSIAGSLQIQLADVSQRSLVTASSQIVFDLGEWTGTDWRWTSLLDTGRLRNSQYSISRQGIGPDDSFTFTAMSEMEDLLGTAPDNNEVWYDPLRHEVTSDDVEGIYDLSGNYYPPTIVSISGMTLHGIMQRIFVTECGFSDFVTNIPDFRVPMVEFSAGQSYAAALSGIIGMFEPTYTWTGTGASLVISVNDGTTGAASGIPSARTVTTSRATSLGVADELDKVRALIMSVNQQRYSFDYWSERNEVTSTDIGNLDLYPGEYVTTQTTTTYRDYFHNSNPDRAVKTEVKRITTESFLGGTELVKETNENFYYDSWGRLYLRSKSVDAKVPNPASSFALSLIPVFEETERLSYRVHPYRPGQYYRSKREVSSAGLVYIDGDNQQLGEDYVRDAVSVYRAGNVTDAMTSDWRKLKTFVERQKPMRNGKVEIKTTEYDYLAKQFTIDELKEEDGQVGVNAFVNEQRRIVVYEPGQTSITGQTMTVNMGELPLSTATALAQRLLRRRLYATERVELSLAGIDPTIQRGMTINPRGRAEADLGTFTVEGRTMNGSPQGYSMSLQARSAATS